MEKKKLLLLIVIPAILLVILVILLLVFLVGLAPGPCGKTQESTTPDNQPNQVAVRSDYAFVAMGTTGIQVIQITDGSLLHTIPPPDGLDSVDDLVVAGNFLFILDAKYPAGVAAMELNTYADFPLRVQSSNMFVSAGPYSTISASGGRILVSGGSGDMTIRDYDTNTGVWLSEKKTASGGAFAGVLMNSGTLGFLATKFSKKISGSNYGLVELSFNSPPDVSAVNVLKRIPIKGAYNSKGAAFPVSWPVQLASFSSKYVIGSYGCGLFVVDAQNPQNPVLKEIPLDFHTYNIQVDEDSQTAYVLGLDAKNKDAPRLLSFTLSDAGTGLTVGTPAVWKLKEQGRGLAIHSQNVVVTTSSGVVLVPRCSASVTTNCLA